MLTAKASMNKVGHQSEVNTGANPEPSTLQYKKSGKNTRRDKDQSQREEGESTWAWPAKVRPKKSRRLKSKN